MIFVEGIRAVRRTERKSDRYPCIILIAQEDSSSDEAQSGRPNLLAGLLFACLFRCYKKKIKK